MDVVVVHHENVLGIADHPDVAMLQQHDALAVPAHGVEIVADKNVVLPSPCKRWRVAKHCSWNSWSPTASTSSRSKMSKSIRIAIEYASRTFIPDEKFLSF